MPTFVAGEMITILYVFYCKETAKCFSGLEKGRHPQVDEEVVLYFVSETLAKQLPFFMPSDCRQRQEKLPKSSELI